MKILLQLSLVLVALLINSSLLGQDKLPNRFEVLTNNYEKAIERANKPITQKYIGELKKLQRDATKLGDLEQALQIEKKLKELGAIEKTLKDLLLQQPWIYTAGSTNTKFIFLPDGTIGGGTPWRLDDDLTLTITYGDGNTCTFKFKDLENLSVEGRTKRGNQLRRLRPMN